MTPGEPVTPPLIVRMGVALEQLKVAREENNPTHEWGWSNLLDRLLDTHIKLLQATGTFRPLSELDPELDARLSVKLDYKLIGHPK